MSRWRDEREREKKKAAEKKAKPQVPTLEEFEEGMTEDLQKVRESFRERKEREDKRFADVCDSNYYFVVCFSNNAQMVEFCERVGLNADEIYVDGREFASKINRALKTPNTDFPKVQNFGRDYKERAR